MTHTTVYDVSTFPYPLEQEFFVLFPKQKRLKRGKFMFMENDTGIGFYLTDNGKFYRQILPTDKLPDIYPSLLNQCQ